MAVHTNPDSHDEELEAKQACVAQQDENYTSERSSRRISTPRRHLTDVGSNAHISLSYTSEHRGA